MIGKTVKGTVLLTADYQMIYPHIDDDHVRDPRWVEGWMFLHEMAPGDQITIRFSTYDEIGLLLRGYSEIPISGSQGTVPTVHLGAVLTPWFRAEIKQQTAPSAFKNINFLFYEVF